MIEFKGFNPFLKQLRADKGFRIEFDLDESQYDKVKDLPLKQDVLLSITVKEEE